MAVIIPTVATRSYIDRPSREIRIIKMKLSQSATNGEWNDGARPCLFASTASTNFVINRIDSSFADTGLPPAISASYGIDHRLNTQNTDTRARLEPAV